MCGRGGPEPRVDDRRPDPPASSLTPQASARWDVKGLVRLLLNSATFRQEARSTPELQKRDPENRLYAHGPRFRLDAEQIRDNALAVSGLLDLSALSAANRVTLQLKSLDANGLTGNLAVQNFAWNDPKNFTLFSYGTLSLGSGVSVSDVFTIDYSGFKDEHGNVARADWFTISNDTNAGAIVLTAIPEPSTYAACAGAAVLGLAFWRRRRAAAKAAVA